MITIKGLDMPKDGTLLILGIYGGRCVLVERHESFTLRTDPKVQVVEIPDEVLKTMIDSYWVASNLVGNTPLVGRRTDEE